MSVFRKRPVEIEARQFVKGSTPGLGYELASWCGGRFNTDVKPSDPSDVCYWWRRESHRTSRRKEAL